MDGAALARLRGGVGCPLRSARMSVSEVKHVTIGHGIQNYTCQSNLSAPPVAIGAVATLYDVTPLAFLSSSTSSQIPAIAAQQPLTNSLVPNAPLSIPGLGSFPILGFHFFSSNGTPVFDLNMVGEVLFSKKLADIKAPANASIGIEGTGAVDWLALTAIGGSVGLQEVFRVDTAGGSPPASCEGYVAGDVVSVPYKCWVSFLWIGLGRGLWLGSEEDHGLGTKLPHWHRIEDS
jgi:hypothetical protein